MVICAGQLSAGDGTIVDTEIVAARDQPDVSNRRRRAGADRRAAAITVENVSLSANLAQSLQSRMMVDHRDP